MWFRHGILLLSCCLLMLGCSLSSLNLDQQIEPNLSEQLYLDARLEFALSHPLNWQRLHTPVSSPAYRADRVRWQIIDSQQQSCGEMLVTSLNADQDRSLKHLLFSDDPQRAGLPTDLPVPLELPAGPALQLQNQFPEHARLTAAIKGQGKDFIVDFIYPANRSDQLLPIFRRILDSIRDLSNHPDQN